MSVTLETLRKFSSFRQLSEDQQQMLLSVGEVKLLKAFSGDKIITRGSNDEFSFFLVTGTLKLIARDGQTVIIKADSPSARQPITQLKPRQYDVLADGPVTYLKVESQVLENLSAGMQTLTTGIQVENEPGNADVYFQLYHDIKSDQVVLPTLPDVAIKINKAIAESEKSNLLTLGHMVLIDPAIAAKLIKLSHTPRANVQAPEVEDINQVMGRLGLHKVSEVVRVLSVKDVFRPVNQLHNQLMKDVWQESILVSSIAAQLAEESELLDPQKAQLVGLVHNVGAILILDCLDKDKSLIADLNQMRAIIAELGSNIGAMLLDKWGFAEQFVCAAKDSQQWKRSNEGRPLDYCDLVILAKLLSYVGTPKFENMPLITDLPAFRKLKWQKNHVMQGLQVINKSRQRVQNLLQVFD